MSWMILILAGFFEIGWAVGLKYTDGFTRLWPSVATGVALVVSVGLLGMAVKQLPLGTAYAIWTGIGAIGTVILGIVLFGESASLVRLACVGLILTGLIGLKLVTPSPH
jgi:quaternary ammonium compound-resistance protein SugE